MMLELLWGLLAIILIDIVLGGENALVIAMATKGLPDELRKKAIFWGTFGAVGVRFLCVLALSYLLLIPGLKVVGGALLLYIGWKLVSDTTEHKIETKTTFWGAISTVILADAVMGLDNALGIAGAASGNWWLIVFGLLISVPIIIYGSTYISKFLDKYPDSIFFGSFILFTVAFQMITTEKFVHDFWWDDLHELTEKVVPFLAALVLTAKQYYRYRIRNETKIS